MLTWTVSRISVYMKIDTYNRVIKKPVIVVDVQFVSAMASD